MPDQRCRRPAGFEYARAENFRLNECISYKAVPYGGVWKPDEKDGSYTTLAIRHDSKD